MSKVLILGTGAFGTAIANVLMFNHHEVLMYGIDPQEVQNLSNGINQKYFPNKKLFAKPILATNNLNDIFAHQDIEYIVIAVPSKAINTLINEINTYIKPHQILINLSKGIDNESGMNYFDTIRKQLPNNEVVAIVGPTFAIDLIDFNYSCSNVVSCNREAAMKVKQVFETNFFKLIYVDDEIGCSLLSGLKNVLAIGCGILNGLKMPIDTIASFLTCGFNEIKKILNKCGAKSETLISFAGFGDLYLTCSSPKSRNFTFGLLVAELGPEKALQTNNNTVEGLQMLKNIWPLIEYDHEYNILKKMYNLIYMLTIDINDFVKDVWNDIE